MFSETSFIFPQIDAGSDERYDETTTLGKNVMVVKYIACLGQELETKSVLHSFRWEQKWYRYVVCVSFFFLNKAFPFRLSELVRTIMIFVYNGFLFIDVSIIFRAFNACFDKFNKPIKMYGIFFVKEYRIRRANI